MDRPMRWRRRSCVEWPASFPIQAIGIAKDGGSLFKWDTVLLKVGNRLRDIHVSTFVYIHEPGGQKQVTLAY